MGRFSDIVAALRGNREAVIPTAQVFPVQDVGQLKRRLDLDQKALAHGKANRPATTAVPPDPIETEIDAVIEGLARKAYEDYQAQIETYEARIRQARTTGNHRVAVEAAGTSTLADFNAQVIDDLNHLYIARNLVGSTSAELRAFKAKHHLDRPAVAKNQWEKRGAWMLVVVILLLESIINGTFFAKGSEAGLIGGITQALILSAFNVGGALLFVLFGVPRAMHRKKAWKAVGVASIVAWGLWLVGVNLAIAHFRDLYATYGEDVKMGMLLQALQSHPFIMQDVQSTILCLLGIVFAVAVAIDIGKARELYPGYGEVSKAATEAIQRYSEASTTCLKDMQQMRDNALADMHDALRTISAAAADLNRAVEGERSLSRNYGAFLDHLRLLRAQLTNVYRDTNRSARAKPEPSYFAEPPAPLQCLAAPYHAPLASQQDDLSAQVASRIEEFIRRLNDRLEEALSRYPSIEELASLEREIRGTT